MSDEIKVDQAKAAYYDAQTRKVEIETKQAEIELAFAEDKRRSWKVSEDATRQMPFNTQVSKASVAEAISYLGQWYREDPGKPITITFNSPGGSVIDGLALFDFIQQLRAEGAKINTKTIGFAASMAGVLLQAGEERKVGRNAYLMIHEVSTGAIGNVSELEDELALTKRMQDRLLDILAERSTLSKNQIRRKWKRKDWWLDAEEAVRLGFADTVA
jgi:ATP-dependent Clp endopeptidase proteolytic subunit ClpP